MTSAYNRVAGQNLTRLEALSDGVFAVAMTLLVLDLHTPVVETIHGEADLGRALLALAPRLFVYLMSFLTLGIFWVGQQTQLNHLARTDRNHAWLHLAFLFAVSLMPFSTSLIAQFISYRAALLVYWANIALLGGVLYVGWRYATKAQLLQTELPDDLACAIEGRIAVAQGLYAFGAALCVVSTYLSLGFILLVQLNYILAPRLPRRMQSRSIDLHK
jgi:uncharacterized membrane protein